MPAKVLAAASGMRKAVAYSIINAAEKSAFW
jgi:hypothetical protein